MPELIPAPRVSFDLTADEYARLALNAHDRACPTCRHDGDGRCPRGRLLAAAIGRAGDEDLPGYLTDLAYPAL